MDTSLRERHGIVALLERIREDGVSLQDLEEIGVTLRQSGRRALRPLMRELWRESDGELISRYTYLLDFFETDAWLDQLIQIALKRRDLGPDGKAALSTCLKGYGVDTQSPQLSLALDWGSPTAAGPQQWGGGGDEGIVSYLDDFLSYPLDVQLVVLRELPNGGAAQSARMLEALLWHQEERIVAGALDALGRLRDPAAAGVLARYLEEAPSQRRQQTEKSLRRLAFLGVPAPEETPLFPFHAGYASAPDGDGYRSLFVSRYQGDGRLTALYLQVHERRGLLAAWGGEGLTLDAFEAELEGFSCQEELHEVGADHVVELVRNALYRSGELAYLPADFYLRRSMFRGRELAPLPFAPSFDDLPERCLTFQEGEKAAEDLLADPLFAGWFMAEERVTELAREFREGGDREEVLARFCAELFTPNLDLIRERLLTCADLMCRLGRDPRLVEKAVALARSLTNYRLPHHLHPFLRLFALESLEVARGSLERGRGARPEEAGERW